MFIMEQINTLPFIKGKIETAVLLEACPWTGAGYAYA
jgi:hypothetical protein